MLDLIHLWPWKSMEQYGVFVMLKFCNTLFFLLLLPRRLPHISLTHRATNIYIECTIIWWLSIYVRTVKNPLDDGTCRGDSINSLRRLKRKHENTRQAEQLNCVQQNGWISSLLPLLSAWQFQYKKRKQTVASYAALRHNLLVKNHCRYSGSSC